MTNIQVRSRARRWSGTLAYVVFVLVVSLGVNRFEQQNDDRRELFVKKVCVALDDFRVATNDRNEPLYTLVLTAEQQDPTVGDDGRPLTPAEQKEKAKVLQAFKEAYKPIPPITNCEAAANGN